MNSINYSKDQSLCFWLSYIEKIYPKKECFSIDKVKLVAKKLGLLNMKSFFFTVSGTNGKGSVCYFLEKFLLNSGYKVGLYTSPHLIHYYERIRVNGLFIKDDTVHIATFKNIELLRDNIRLTYFEFITLSALLIFKEFNLDIIILEVGIGGRLDATNIINPNIAIITNINLDHTKLLGYNRNQIGFEKAGIFRKGIYAVLADRNIPSAIYQTAYYLRTYLHRINYEWDWNKLGNFWNFYDKNGGLYKLPIPSISLNSTATALSALRRSGFIINRNILKESIKQVFLPGRFHTIFCKPRIIVDVAHNPHAAYYLYNRLKELLLKVSSEVKVYGLIGMVFDKDIKNTIFPLLKIINFWYYAPIKTFRSVDIAIFKKYLPNLSIQCCSIEHALNILIKKVKLTDIILIFGSFFTVSEAILFIQKKYDIKINF